MSKPIKRRVGIIEGVPADFISVGSSRVLNSVDHANRTMTLDALTGSTAILPPATGSGLKYNFIVKTLPTSNSHIVRVANAADSMQGVIVSRSDANATASFNAIAGTSDTITLNRTTTGAVVVGEMLIIQDVGLNRYEVTGTLANTGTAATPFSATV